MAFRRITSTVLALALAFAATLGTALAGSAPVGKVNVNTATVSELDSLPGVGPAIAARIVEHRQKAGPFKSVQELMNIRGIGEKSLAKMQPYLTVGEPKAAH